MLLYIVYKLSERSGIVTPPLKCYLFIRWEKEHECIMYMCLWVAVTCNCTYKASCTCTASYWSVSGALLFIQSVMCVS